MDRREIIREEEKEREEKRAGEWQREKEKEKGQPIPAELPAELSLSMLPMSNRTSEFSVYQSSICFLFISLLLCQELIQSLTGSP